MSAPNDYDPSLEWPGAEEGEMFESSFEEPSTSLFRLVALESGVLSSKHRLAILTGYPEIQIGRDKPISDSVVPRIRLAEMPVSKTHATAFWDGARREWALVDMGSMHGTFIKSGPEQPAGSSSASNSTDTQRLSPSRVASMPRTLRHLDRVTIGSTTFEVHLHADNLACSVCASTANEIPLFHTSRKAATKAPEPTPELPAAKVNPKKSLAMLKSSLLNQHHDRSPSSSGQYTDRADRRRRMYGSLPSNAHPPLAPRPEKVQGNEAAQQPLVSDPPRQITASNVGHGLLTKMGWEPGTTLGLSSVDGDDNGGSGHLHEPIQPKHTARRAGLGASLKRDASSNGSTGLDWRESEKRRRQV